MAHRVDRQEGYCIALVNVVCGRSDGIVGSSVERGKDRRRGIGEAAHFSTVNMPPSICMDQQVQQARGARPKRMSGDDKFIVFPSFFQKLSHYIASLAPHALGHKRNLAVRFTP
mmetsp:Transcript_39369/g.72652  ORF Transcript_39369/g.72652 Transcript_39369/m.72652 type:complete len:114 (+) Transcript_39369:208-549(+)